MTKAIERKTKRRTQRARRKTRRPRVLMTMTGRGVRDGWLKFQLPAWLVVFLLVASVLVCVALIASPDLAAKLAALFGTWFATQKP